MKEGMKVPSPTIGTITVIKGFEKKTVKYAQSPILDTINRVMIACNTIGMQERTLQNSNKVTVEPSPPPLSPSPPPPSPSSPSLSRSRTLSSPIKKRKFPSSNNLSKDPKFIPVLYNKPRRNDMAVILVFFNPSFSNRIIQNILMVKHFLDNASIPYFIGEVAFDETPFLFKETANIFCYRSTSYMFYKENLIHAVEKRIPSDFTKLCALDADIMFDNPEWYSIISTTLDSCKVCQPFTETYLLRMNFRFSSFLVNSVDATKEEIVLSKEHPGHVWAFDREWYQSAKISDMTVIGGGDFFLLTSIKKITMNHPNIELYKDIHKPCYTAARSCPLTIYHLSHSSNVNRQYTDRITNFKEVCGRNNIKDTMIRREDGILEWNPAYKTAINRMMQTYFNTRDDDSVYTTVTKNIKFIPEVYQTPSIRDLAVILVFFNATPYNRILQNIIMVKHYMDQANIPYFIAELAFKDQQFVFNAADNVFQYRSDSYMFYKENLLAVAEPRIPSTYTKLCILDADIFFDKPNWYSIISNTLNRVDVVQPFKKCYWLDLEYKHILERTNCIDSSSKSVMWESEHPGFVWAFNRNWAGLKYYLDIKISSIGGDTVLYTLLKHTDTKYNMFYNLEAIPKTTYDSCNLIVYHLNHGVMKNRKYVNVIDETKKKLTKFKLTDASDLVLRREDSILEWKPDYKTEMNTFMKTYFDERHEDEI